MSNEKQENTTVEAIAKGIVVAMIAIAILAFLVWIGPAAISFAWGWLVPELFPGLVENGYFPESITWTQGFGIMCTYLVMQSWALSLKLLR